MAESSTGTNTDRREKDECPICLHPIPTNVQGEDGERKFCCGALICYECVHTLVENVEKDYRILQDELERGEPAEASIESFLAKYRCPLCRTNLPLVDQERFDLVQNNIEQHPDWVWPLYQMGRFYELGCGCPQDLKKSMKYYQMAAERGHVKAQHLMGNYYNLGALVDKSIPDAIYWYTLACEQGFALSQFSLGVIYYNQKNYEEAFPLLLLSSEQGFDPAQTKLAWCYEHGYGVTPSLDKSMDWNKKAADQGNATAMGRYAGNILVRARQRANGGRFDEVGNSVIPETIYWLRKANSLGYKDPLNFVSLVETVASKSCANCGMKKEATTDQKLSMCPQCHAVAYCSKECEEAYWDKGHKWDCIDENGVKQTRE